jgi:DNA-binding response OmpR family regulator
VYVVMAQDLRVLLVEAHPSVRSLLLGAVSSMARVQACGSASEAMRISGPQPPDLIIADYRLPRTSGIELIFQMRACFPNIPAIVLATHEEMGSLLAASTSIVEEFIEKPFFIEEATLRIRRVLDRISLSRKAQQANENSGLRGSLAQMSPVDLLQALDLGHKSCRLRLNYRGQECHMHFLEGQLVHATLGQHIGEAAVFPVITWSEGGFAIDFERENCPQTITRSTQSLLLEGMRRYDEAQRDAATAQAAARRTLYPAAVPAGLPLPGM